ncbi:hypothetical protein HYV88_02025 [Candidatus Woesearchaeota archaeon]|nr:hypothetical protein [Candidatus Woesearchaeota archaeon]
MIRYSELVDLYNRAIDTVTRYNYPDDKFGDRCSLEHRVQVERNICWVRLRMIHPDSPLAQTIPREKLATQYNNIIHIYGRDPSPHRKKPAA